MVTSIPRREGGMREQIKKEKRILELVKKHLLRGSRLENFIYRN